MPHPTIVLLVKFKSRLSLDEIQDVIDSRINEFRALDGLKQKYYLQDTMSGEYAGLYFWESPDALADFRDSALRNTVAYAYQTEGEPRAEVFQIIDVLRDIDS